jgi:hypothetical protein
VTGECGFFYIVRIRFLFALGLCSLYTLLQRARIGRSRHNVEDVVSCVLREAVALQATE